MTTPATPTTTDLAAPGTTTAPAGGRLPSGELRRQVAEYLAAHPSWERSPRQIAKALGRSSGAVGNALTVLTARGEVERTLTNPLRYKANTATTAAAKATAPVPTMARKHYTPPPATPSTKASPHETPGVDPLTEKVSGPVKRPNGQTYHPRTLSGLPDVTALRKLRAAGVPVLLYGPPGTGKTSVVEAAYPDLITVQGDGDTTVADFVGEYTQTPDGRYVFVHGPLVTAMCEGRCLFIDDATLIPPTVLAVVYPAMDGRRQITVKANGGETVTAAPGFYVVAGHNPGVHGAVLTDALSSRFSAQIQVSTDFDLAKQLKIDRRAVRAARNLTTRQRKGEIGRAPQLRELIAFSTIADVLGTEAAAANLVGVAPEEDRDTVAAVVRDAFGMTVEPLALGGRI
ncbi:AAA domain-containing protein [Saccharopolyspora hirsuta]|uniref:AAA domain-containing protein n=1 Tax=Saccharopolyspora hirsuta TaxID=1837 RepID=A0A5M7BB02_SACHI|nr:AAA family ATPase [Saccharopolyspora hirsuta]KAA5825437.1 AAA domain-containing protein [Saccharopolyspora hirsuta]